MKRKTRVRTVSVPKEDGFICSKCGAKGDCGDSIKDKTPFYWDEKEKNIICKKCGRQLCKKSELEDELEVPEIQLYGFWLRFASEHFIPCEKCQDKLHKMLMSRQVAFYEPECITLELLEKKKKPVWQFLLRFIQCGALSNGEVFRPCDECQKELTTIWTTKKLHIGNDIKPMVELWRKWDIVDEPEDK